MEFVVAIVVHGEDSTEWILGYPHGGHTAKDQMPRMRTSKRCVDSTRDTPVAQKERSSAALLYFYGISRIS